MQTNKKLNLHGDINTHDLTHFRITMQKLTVMQYIFKMAIQIPEKDKSLPFEKVFPSF